MSFKLPRRKPKSYWDNVRQRERWEQEAELTPMMLSMRAMDVVIKRYMEPRLLKPQKRKRPPLRRPSMLNIRYDTRGRGY